jgi:UDP-N-acetylglucosamine 2-epimerase (non-hydrolysing)
VGTRPECIKMAPVILAMGARDAIRLQVVSTGQHREMTKQTLEVFGITPDIDMDIMLANQSLSATAAKILSAFDKILEHQHPDLVLVQGDTTTVMACSVACFFRGVAVGHVEAGLRTNTIRNPFPEEYNRRVACLGATLHFAPNDRARLNLLKEGVASPSIFVTGNTVIDALLQVASNPSHSAIPQKGRRRRMILVTAHRRENFGAPLQNICNALATIVTQHSDVEIVYPVHPNPNVRDIIMSRLAGIDRINLIDPLPYSEMVQMLTRSYIVLTDSGGLQEEAPALGKPVLVLRDETERPDAVEAGVSKLVGTDEATIVRETSKLLDDEVYYASMARGASLYGDGHAARRIVEACLNFLSNKVRPNI